MIDKLLFGVLFLAGLLATLLAVNKKQYQTWVRQGGEPLARRRRKNLLTFGPPLLFFSAIALLLKLLL